jgi:putative ABC transport system permease protein
MHETSYDDFNRNGKYIYRVMRVGNFNGVSAAIPYVSPMYGPTLQHDYAGDIQKSVRVDVDNDLVTYHNVSFNEKKIILTDSNFFNFFDYPLLRGDPATVLSEPLSIVMTESTAKKYFGNEDPIGKVVDFNKDLHLKVTGIAKDIPTNSHIDFDMAVPLSNWRNAFWMNQWPSNNLFAYVQLNPKTDPQNLIKRFPPFMDRYLGKFYRDNGFKMDLTIHPLRGIYFEDALPFESGRHGSLKMVYIFMSIAVLILIIACINFINLSTARASDRSKEVGMRKVLGAMSNNLRSQFIMESILMAALATFLAVIAVQLLLPAYTSFLGHALPVFWAKWWFYAFVIAVIVIVGLLAGSYPAVLLSRFSPIESLKGKFISGREGAFFRKALVVFQFSISVILIFSVAIVLNQMRYVRNTDLGFDKEQSMMVRIDNGLIYDNRVRFKELLLQNPSVASVSLMSGEPGGFFDNYGFDAQAKPGERMMFNTEFADFDYAKTLGLKIIAGRDLSGQYPTDTMRSVLINRVAAVKMGYAPEQAIGKWVKNLTQDSLPRIIVGVVEDFHFSSLKDLIAPLVISPKIDDRRLVLVKLRSGIDLPGTIDQISKIYKANAPDYPFEYKFLDDTFNNLYKSEATQESLLGLFAGIAIFVACLGLFGLASYTAVKRTKEIGVRKVLGSSVENIVLLLSQDLLKPVILGSFIALPLGYLMMEQWLQGFAYRIRVEWWLFGLAAVAGILIALITVGFQALKAAIASPVKSLRSE